MKSNKVLLTSILSLALIYSCSKEEESTDNTPKTPAGCFDNIAYTDQLPNMDFEQWGYPDSSQNKYKEPCGGIWTSSNAVSVALDAITVVPSNDAQNGSLAVSIKTESVLGGLFKAPGIFFTGRFLNYQPTTNIRENAEFGVPFTRKPKSLNGFQKYTSVKSDSAYIVVLLTKYNTDKKMQDTIGFGDLTLRNTNPNYEAFDIPISYNFNESGSEPDSVLIVFTSSKGAEDLLGEIGSQLKIDNCIFVY